MVWLLAPTGVDAAFGTMTDKASKEVDVDANHCQVHVAHWSSGGSTVGGY